MIKQILIVRKDLNMRKGKIASQCAHASMKVFFDKTTILKKGISDYLVTFDIQKEEKEWIEGSFTKVVVSINSEEELLKIYKQAQDAKLLCALVTDNGLTEFHGNKTHTVIAIGPADSEDIDKITKDLPLL